METLELHELKPNEYNIEKLYRKNNKHYAVYLIQGERWQYPLSEKLYSELLQEFKKETNKMKYFRTKDKILLFRDYEDIDSVLTNIGWIHKTEIVKQADTIEELLDEFVHITNIGNHILGLFWSPDSSDTVYGAVWTEKGLIYVAKLNEKGKWELI